jgi:hypothetical protein
MKLKENLLYQLGAAGFNVNYFLLALLQSSILILAERFVHHEIG